MEKQVGSGPPSWTALFVVKLKGGGGGIVLL